MELYQIRYFLAVAELLNFTRAAERCFVSQPALTKGIRRLEDNLGGRLFDRTKSSVQLTELGSAMRPHFEQIFRAAQATRDEARRLARGRGDAIKVGIMCTVDIDLILPAFTNAGGNDLAVEVSFREGSLESLIDAVDRGDLNLGIMCSPYEIPRRFDTFPLFHEAYVVGIGDDHRFLGRDGIEMKELHREHYCERTRCEFSSYIERLLDDRGIELEVVQQSPREDWIQAFVRANFGVAFMPESIAQAARLSYVHVADCPIVREMRILRQSGRPVSAEEEAVIASLRSYEWSKTKVFTPVAASVGSQMGENPSRPA